MIAHRAARLEHEHHPLVRGQVEVAPQSAPRKHHVKPRICARFVLWQQPVMCVKIRPERLRPPRLHQRPTALIFRQILLIPQPVPELLRDERHERMKQPQRVRKHKVHHRARVLSPIFVAAVESRFRRLQIPVAVFVPEKPVQRLRRIRKAVLIQRRRHFADRRVEPQQNPFVVGGKQLAADLRLGSASLHFPKPRGIPKFGAEVAPQFDVLFVEQHVLPERRAPHHSKPQRIRPELRNQIQRIRRIPERLRHLAPLLVPDDPRKIHVLERQRPRVLEPGHDHARHPEENNVRPRHQIRCWIKRLQRRRRFRPAHRRKRPQPRRKPRVQHVRVLFPRRRIRRRREPAVRERSVLQHAAGFLRRARGHRLPRNRRVAPRKVPHRNPVPPPELARNAPVLQVLHPVVVHLRPAVREKAHLARAHHLARRLDGRVFQKPLPAQARLDRHIRTLRKPDVVLMRLLLLEQLEGAQQFDRNLPRLEPLQPREILPRQRVHRAVGIHHIHVGQLVPRADFKIRLVVRRRHLQHPGAERKVHVLVANDRDEPFLPWLLGGKRPQRVQSDERRVARILRIHRDGRVARDRLRPRRGDAQKSAGLFGNLDFEMRELPVLGFHHDFFVGKSGARYGAPVHHAFAAVDGALLEEVDKDALHAGGVFRIHREAFPVPVAGGTEFFELLDDDPAVLILPFPDFLQKLVAAEVVPVADGALFFESFFHHGLGGDAGVVGAGQPEHFLAKHPGAPGEDVLDGVVEDVAEGEDAGDVGRGDDDRVGGAFLADALWFGFEAT